MFKNSQRGQALLIVVLAMVVALTVGLSVVSKSITNLRTSTEEANSQKALAAAEAGIEQAIKNGVSIAQGSFSNDTTYSTEISQVLGASFLLNGGNPVVQDGGIDLWLSDYSENEANLYNNPWPPGGGNGNLTIKWGSSSDPCSNAAIQVVLITGNKASPAVRRYAYDPCAARRGSNNFASAPLVASSISGKTLYYEATIAVSSGLIGKIIPIYFNTPVGVIGSVALPLQGSTITSIGKSGGTERKVNVFQGYPEIPSEFFLYNLLSP